MLRVTSRHNQSILCQRYILYADADQLEVETTLDLHEKHKLVKQCYPTDFRQNFAEIPYGVIERAPNGDEEAHQRWTAVQGVSGGLAVLNNGKYSYSVSNGELRVTLAILPFLPIISARPIVTTTANIWIRVGNSFV